MTIAVGDLSMVRIKYILLFVVSVMFMSGIACGESAPAATPTPVVVIDANLRNMLNLFESNKIAAEATYKGKWVEFSGRISEIKEDKFDLIPMDSDEFQMSGAECKLIKGQQSAIIELRADDRVTVTGKVKDIGGWLTTKVKLDNCQIVN